MPEKNNNEFVFPANLALAIEEESSFSEQQKINAYAALCRYLIFETEPTDITLRMFCKAVKVSIENEIKRKKQISELKRNCVLQRWNKKTNITENKFNEQNEIIVPENQFISLTDDFEIRSALENPDSAISVFLETGARYDELSTAEREFVDRADVRKLCSWYKETSSKINEVKNLVHPTLDEVLEYARQQNSMAGIGGFVCNDTDAEQFWSYYESQGWRIGNDSNTPIRDWRPKLRQWCVKAKQESIKQAQKTTNKTTVLNLSSRERQDLINKQKTEMLLKKLREQGN